MQSSTSNSGRNYLNRTENDFYPIFSCKTLKILAILSIATLLISIVLSLFTYYPYAGNIIVLLAFVSLFVSITGIVMSISRHKLRFKKILGTESYESELEKESTIRVPYLSSFVFFGNVFVSSASFIIIYPWLPFLKWIGWDTFVYSQANLVLYLLLSSLFAYNLLRDTPRTVDSLYTYVFNFSFLLVFLIVLLDFLMFSYISYPNWQNLLIFGIFVLLNLIFVINLRSGRKRTHIFGFWMGLALAGLNIYTPSIFLFSPLYYIMILDFFIMLFFVIWFGIKLKLGPSFLYDTILGFLEGFGFWIALFIKVYTAWLWVGLLLGALLLFSAIIWPWIGLWLLILSGWVFGLFYKNSLNSLLFLLGVELGTSFFLWVTYTFRRDWAMKKVLLKWIFTSMKRNGTFSVLLESHNGIPEFESGKVTDKNLGYLYLKRVILDALKRGDFIVDIKKEKIEECKNGLHGLYKIKSIKIRISEERFKDWEARLISSLADLSKEGHLYFRPKFLAKRTGLTEEQVIAVLELSKNDEIKKYLSDFGI